MAARIIFGVVFAVAFMTIGAIAVAAIAQPQRLQPTASGVIDRTNRTDRIKPPAPQIDLRVVSECRSA